MSLFQLLVLCLCTQISALIEGHGKPLGQHNNLGTPALEADYRNLTSEEFYKKYVHTRTPVILRGLAKTFHAFTLWTDEYIRENYGDLEVRLEAKTEKETYVPTGEVGLGRATFTEFLDRYQTDNMYCVSEIPGPMYKDLELPSIMNCGDMKSALVEMNLWINSGGAKSIIHKDAHNQLNCLLAGSKDWIFINNSYNDGIYQAEEIDGDQGGFSLVNPDEVNYITFPKFAHVPWEHATVNEGDCLYLPPRYYHRVKSTNRNFAISFLFGTHSEFEMSGCDQIHPPLPLQDAEIQWKYPGHGMMSMGNSDPMQMKDDAIKLFLHLTKGDKNAKIPLNQFINELINVEVFEEVPYIKDHLKDELLYKKLLRSETGEVSLDFLENTVQLEVWKSLIAAYSFDPSNDPDSELYYLYKHEIVDVLKDATYYGPIAKDIFLKTYQDLRGSLRKGRELFDQVTSDGSTVSWYDIRDKDGVFNIFGKEHDRGDNEMYERNSAISEKAKVEMAESRKLLNAERAEL